MHSAAVGTKQLLSVCLENLNVVYKRVKLQDFSNHNSKMWPMLILLLILIIVISKTFCSKASCGATSAWKYSVFYLINVSRAQKWANNLRYDEL